MTHWGHFYKRLWKLTGLQNNWSRIYRYSSMGQFIFIGYLWCTGNCEAMSGTVKSDIIWLLSEYYRRTKAWNINKYNAQINTQQQAVSAMKEVPASCSTISVHGETLFSYEGIQKRSKEVANLLRSWASNEAWRVDALETTVRTAICLLSTCPVLAPS